MENDDSLNVSYFLSWYVYLQGHPLLSERQVRVIDTVLHEPHEVAQVDVFVQLDQTPPGQQELGIVVVTTVVGARVHGDAVESFGCGPQINAPFERVRLYGAQQ